MCTALLSGQTHWGPDPHLYLDKPNGPFEAAARALTLHALSLQSYASRATTLKRIRVVLAGMPRTLSDTVSKVIAAEADMEVVAVSTTAHAPFARSGRVDVAVLGERHAQDRQAIEALLYRRPRLKVIALANRSWEATLHELKPRRKRAGVFKTRAALVNAIRDALSS